MRELIIDSFAGGGGASCGIEMALGRSPDIAINHDGEALAMHTINHPETLHLSRNIWQVDPLDYVGNRPVGLAWFSPDCKHHSKAKGARPVKRNIRDLAWVVVLWAKRARPRVIVLENVEEFQDWGPVVPNEAGQYFPCPDRKGETFKRFVKELKRLGYRVEWKELRACDYGAPTIRKRLFLIARRDGAPIVWPEPTHAAPDDPDVIAGKKKPWRTAAEIIDWSLPCPSIFMTREEAKEYHRLTGIRVNRPLAPKTMARIAKGVKRYVLDAAEPFIVTLNHGGDHQRPWSLHEPFRTVTAARDAHALIMPVVTYGQQGGASRDPQAPLHTVTASRKDTNTLAAVHLAKFRGDSGGVSVDQPAPTVTANSYVTRPGGAPPMAVVSAFLAQHNDGPRPGQPGRPADAPVSTVTATGSQQAVVAAHMLSLKGGDGRPRSMEKPVQTVCAEGTHLAQVQAFLMKYYGTDQDPNLAEPSHTVTTKERFGLVMVQGEPWQIVDIGMRMLTPRELFHAQGFPATYIIDRGVDPDGNEFNLTKTAQIRMCGNSVCPPLSEAIVRANYEAEEMRATA